MGLFVPDDSNEKPKAIFGCSFLGNKLLDIGELAFEFYVWWFNAGELVTSTRLLFPYFIDIYRYKLKLIL